MEMDFTLRDSLIKLTSRVIDKKLNNLKDVLDQDNLNELISLIDEHFTDFQTCVDLEDTIFCLEKYLNRRGIGGILTQIPDPMSALQVDDKVVEGLTLRGQTESNTCSKGKDTGEGGNIGACRGREEAPGQGGIMPNYLTVIWFGFGLVRLYVAGAKRGGYDAGRGGVSVRIECGGMRRASYLISEDLGVFGLVRSC